MPYSQEDLAALDAAILRRGGGRQVTQVQTPEGQLRYADTPIAELLTLRDRMARDLGAPPAGQPRPARAFRGTMASGY
ncbi:hypothetical protein VQH23_16215 [Pararoseomonas sp. SCSIO 73927]|uniref:hypothetical protein n=1 Tax=Pararoseomonas sp. SCSIO 73927 TaxID=3114537 RepID=UPI0030CE1F79